MKCTAVRKRDEREGNEYKREAVARKSEQLDGMVAMRTKNFRIRRQPEVLVKVRWGNCNAINVVLQLKNSLGSCKNCND